MTRCDAARTARLSLGAILAAAFAQAACGPPPLKSREEIGVQVEAEGVCTHEGKTLLLSKYPGLDRCGTTPAAAPAEPPPPCTELSTKLGCK